MKKAVKIKVEGMVQGVGFRFHTRKQALHYSLVGWVKNKMDGSVLIHAEGEPEHLQLFINWCHEGPRSARVHHVEVYSVESENFDDFEIAF